MLFPTYGTILMSTNHHKRLIITSGEPAGIGPDLCLLLANHSFPVQLIVAADPELLSHRARQLKLNVNLKTFNPDDHQPAQVGELIVAPLSLSKPCTPGQTDPANGQYVLDILSYAVQGCMDGLFDGMVTGPVHKEVINNAGVPFTGHTEFLAEQTHTRKVVMMLATEGYEWPWQPLTCPCVMSPTRLRRNRWKQ